MKKHILLLFLAVLCTPLLKAQNYVVSSLATPGAATFTSDKIVEGVITLPFAAGTHAIPVETNQNATVTCDDDWCDAHHRQAGVSSGLCSHLRRACRQHLGSRLQGEDSASTSALDRIWKARCNGCCGRPHRQRSVRPVSGVRAILRKQQQYHQSSGELHLHDGQPRQL